MVYCRRCGRFSPSGADYCAYCGERAHSFQGRRCPKGHLAPADAARCPVCGRDGLTDYAPSVRLGWLTRLLAWGLVVLLLGFATRHADLLLSAAALAVRMTAWVLDLGAVPWVRLLDRLLFWMLLALVVSLVLPEAWGKQARGALWSGLRKGVALTLKTVLLLGRLTYRLVEGGKEDAGKPRNKRRARNKD